MFWSGCARGITIQHSPGILTFKIYIYIIRLSSCSYVQLIDCTSQALLLSLMATGFKIPKNKTILFAIGPDETKSALAPFATALSQMGYTVYATTGTGTSSVFAYFSELCLFSLFDCGLRLFSFAIQPLVSKSWVSQ